MSKSGNFPGDRTSIRAPVVPENVQGLVTIEESKEQLPIILWDVATQGVGIWVPNFIDPDAMVKVTIVAPHHLSIRTVVRWCSPAESAQGFRCGLEVIEPSDELFDIYEHYRQKMEKHVGD